MIYLYAGNYQQAQDWAKRQDIARTDWKYLATGDRLEGTERPVVVKIGTYFQHPDTLTIDGMITCRRAVVIRCAY